MPELPEVERERRRVVPALVGKRLAGVATRDDRIVFCDIAPRTFARKISGATVVDIHRWGKYIWFEMDRPPYPVLHFGMTGSFRVYEDVADRPRFWKVEFKAEDGMRVAMTNARRLGRIRLADDPLRQPPLSGLGFDPLLAMPTAKQFISLLTRRSAPLKAVLLDQSFAAGVGNWIADEVCYQARISPLRRANVLTDKEARHIRTCLRRVITTAVRANADKDTFPRSWLFHHRWGRKADAATADGHTVQFETVGGRTTAWVPSLQR